MPRVHVHFTQLYNQIINHVLHYRNEIDDDSYTYRVCRYLILLITKY